MLRHGWRRRSLLAFSLRFPLFHRTMITTLVLTLALLDQLIDAAPLARSPQPRSLKIRGTTQLSKRDDKAQLRAKWEGNVQRAKAASSTVTKTKRATGGVAITDYIQQGVDSFYCAFRHSCW